MPERHRILIVDDDAQDRQAVIQALQRESVRVDGIEADVLEAHTVALAREALRGEEFACVFLDHNLPDGTSLDLLDELRSQGLATPVVVLTGERDEGAIAEVIRAGAVDYLPKDKLHPDLVARSLRAALRFLQVQREKQAVLTELRARDRAIAAASNGIVIADPRQPDTPMVYVNAAFLRMTGYPEDEVLGRNCRFLQGPETDPEAVLELREAVRQGRGCQVPILNYRKNGTTFWNEVTVSPVRDARGALTHFVGIQTDTTARHEADGERLRLLAEQRARAEREALINRINAAIRATTDPEIIRETAAALVGEALGADRCYFSVYDPQRASVRIARDWHRPGLPSVAGEYGLAEYGGYLEALYADGTASIADALAPAVPPAVRRVLEGFGIRAFLAVPLRDGGRFVGALTASMSGGPRAWMEDEVLLMEAALTQTRTATEEARLRLREHRIAEQLARALQPETPEAVPGLALADYYRPAWEDQGVGGDFSDVFSADKGVTFLAVGDLSGKGLEAASQVATVRHMLRFALLNGRSLAGPVTALNRTLADHGLLTGFATLFVCRYDAHARALTYVNCGQDAGLILRASGGRVEPLPPTGPVLGAMSESAYDEETVTLEPGDVLALFTDGLTEAGPTRTALLTGDGVAGLLGGLAGATDPRAVVDALMAGVDAHAGAGVRDDQCLLVAVAA